MAENPDEDKKVPGEIVGTTTIKGTVTITGVQSTSGTAGDTIITGIATLNGDFTESLTKSMDLKHPIIWGNSQETIKQRDRTGAERTLFLIDSGDNIDYSATFVPNLYTYDRSPPYFQRLMAGSDFNEASTIAPEFHVVPFGPNAESGPKERGYCLQKRPSKIALCTGTTKGAGVIMTMHNIHVGVLDDARMYLFLEVPEEGGFDLGFGFASVLMPPKNLPITPNNSEDGSDKEFMTWRLFQSTKRRAMIRRVDTAGASPWEAYTRGDTSVEEQAETKYLETGNDANRRVAIIHLTNEASPSNPDIRIPKNVDYWVGDGINLMREPKARHKPLPNLPAESEKDPSELIPFIYIYSTTDKNRCVLIDQMWVSATK